MKKFLLMLLLATAGLNAAAPAENIVEIFNSRTYGEPDDTYRVDLEATTVGDLMEMIRERNNVPTDYMITIDGKSPDVNATLSDLGIQAGGRFRFNSRPEGTVEIYIKTLTGVTSVHNVNLEKTTVAELRQMVAEKYNIPVDEVRLIFNKIAYPTPVDKPQQDENVTLGDIGVQKESTIHFIPRPVPPMTKSALKR